jgi:alkanesulfonate monooxygenase SsuD/methylene tetrahydromethanopterin reductase-like flavin-dependent oxidoreductase (luciferase family)
MSDHRFRFGVVATPRDGDQWRATAQRVAGLGYSTLLMPDGLQLLSPFPALATAAATADVRVGTFVLAAPLRPPHSAAWEAHSLTVLTGGRFEFGIGTGLPHAAIAAVQELGLPLRSPAERLAAVSEAIDHLRELDGDTHTPVLVAAGGPRARALAAEKADIVTLAAGPLTSRTELAQLVTDIRAHAGDRADDIEFAMNLFVIGDEVPAWTEQFIGADAATLIAHDSLTLLRGDTQEMADELQRRRADLGVSYVCVNAAFSEQLAPVVELLTGH